MRSGVFLLVAIAALVVAPLGLGESPAPGPTLNIALTGGGPFTPGGDPSTVDFTITNKQTAAFNSIAITITNGPNKLTSGTCPDGFTADLKHATGWLYCIGKKADAVAVGGTFKGTLSTAAAGGWSESVGGIYADAYGVNDTAANAPATQVETPATKEATPAAKQADLAVSVTLNRNKITVPLEREGHEIPPSPKVTYSVTVSNNGPDTATIVALHFDWRFQYGQRLADPTAYSWFGQHRQATPPDVACIYQQDELDYRCVLGELKKGEKRELEFGFEIAAANQDAPSKDIADDKDFYLVETTAKTTAGQATRAWKALRSQGVIMSSAAVVDTGGTEDPVELNNVAGPSVTLQFGAEPAK
jgi:hypothetical protein